VKKARGGANVTLPGAPPAPVSAAAIFLSFVNSVSSIGLVKTGLFSQKGRAEAS
jgi:hypothetical protein